MEAHDEVHGGGLVIARFNKGRESAAVHSVRSELQWYAERQRLYEDGSVELT